MRHLTHPPLDLIDRTAALVEKARKLRRKGETRKAVVALREACLVSENQPSVWCLYGALLAEIGKREEAENAFRQALWLRKREGDIARARVTQTLLDRVSQLAA
ncbi:MAG: hypothetical protein U0165_20850 [Polyangiaceae bacterium]